MPMDSLLGVLLIGGAFVVFGGCLAWADWYSSRPLEGRPPQRS
jgi:hypothetical protein